MDIQEGRLTCYGHHHGRFVQGGIGRQAMAPSRIIMSQMVSNDRAVLENN